MALVVKLKYGEALDIGNAKIFIERSTSKWVKVIIDAPQKISVVRRDAKQVESKTYEPKSLVTRAGET